MFNSIFELTTVHGWKTKKIRDIACWYHVRTALVLYEKKDVVRYTNGQVDSKPSR